MSELLYLTQGAIGLQNARLESSSAQHDRKYLGVNSSDAPKGLVSCWFPGRTVQVPLALMPKLGSAGSRVQEVPEGVHAIHLIHKSKA